MSIRSRTGLNTAPRLRTHFNCVCIAALAALRSIAACDCAPLPAPAQALADSDSVFAGEAIAFERLDPTLSFAFRVERAWKGPVPERVTVYTASDSAACGFPFVVGRRYLVYADFTNPEAPNCEQSWLQLAANSCGRTAEYADEEARALGEPLWSAPAPFLRGDADASGEIDISDMIRVLLHLFGGGEPTLCEDAMDVNDDGALDLADPILGLGYLFTRGAAPPPPGPAAPGFDPTDGDPFHCGDASSLRCPAETQSTLPGVRLEIADGPCRLTLAEAAQGVVFTYRVIVDKDLENVVTRALATCQQAGASGLYLLPRLANAETSFCICDAGHCPALESTVHLIAGSYVSTMSWCGRSWFGPSDFQNPVGEPFPPGKYRFEVRGEGRLADESPWAVTASYEVELVP